MRVLITGMGGELGTRVANLLEADDRVDEILGIDSDPPRRMLKRAVYERVDPRDRLKISDVVCHFRPTAVVHLGIYEPFARSGPTSSVERTAVGTVATLEAAMKAGALDRLVVRSGIEVYGRRRFRDSCPSENTVADPTTAFGQSLLHVELFTREIANRIGIPATLLRCAPIVGPHFPSPLGRLLRLPIVPFSPLNDPPFALLHQEDAAMAIIGSLFKPYDGALNIVPLGTVTMTEAARMGHRIPVPFVASGFRFAYFLSEMAGAPVPPHVKELITRGRIADGALARTILGIAPGITTHEVVERLYRWDEVTYMAVPQAKITSGGIANERMQERLDVSHQNKLISPQRMREKKREASTVSSKKIKIEFRQES